MKSGKLIGLVLITSLVAIIVGGYLVFNKNVEAALTNSFLFAGDAYSVTFKEAIAERSLTNGSVAVVDAKEQAVKVKLSLDKTGKTLTVEGLPAGKYTIQVKKDAYVKTTKLQDDQTIALEVVKKVEKITSVEDLENYFKTFLAVQNFSLTNQYSGEVSEEKASVESSDSSAFDKGGAGGDYSTTNNQVEGIEEGDITITDGKFIYTIVDNRIVIVDTKDLKVVKRLNVGKDIYPSHLMLHNDTLIIGFTAYIQTQKVPYYDGKSVTKIAFYDVKDAKNAKLIREVGQDGDLTNIRKAGNYLYVVSSKTPNYWILQESPDADVELRPSKYDGGQETLLPLDKIRILPESNQPNYLMVSAIDVSKVASADWKTESFLGNSGQLYMSENAIYITSMNYGFWPMMEATSLDDTVSRPMPAKNNETTIYKLAIDQTTIKLAAEGKVVGSVLNQFSMDEHNGYFRIATTEGNAWGTEANSKNHLYILDKNLKQVGAVNDLAKGERIYSARFMGDKAYLVTFKETDPLFVIDTKNPTAPKVLGELKIPGFSNYLHPIDENHLLGIGYDTEVRMEQGSKEPIVMTKGMKLSLFDVTDFNKPKEKQAVVIGDRGTYSSVQYDHKALFRDPRNNYYGFPITVYGATDDDDRLKYKSTGAQIYKVTTAGIELAANLMEPARPGEQYEDYYNVVQRILYVNDQLYTVSRSKMTSFDGKTFEKQQMIGF